MAAASSSDGSLTHENAERPLTAKEGVAYFKEQALTVQPGFARCPAGDIVAWTRSDA